MQRNRRVQNNEVRKVHTIDSVPVDEISTTIDGKTIAEITNHKLSLWLSLPPGTIESVSTGILSGEEIMGVGFNKGISIMELTNSELSGYGSVNDTRLGSSNTQSACTECHLINCDGHFSHIKLALMMINPPFEKHVEKYLNILCSTCGNIVLPKSKLSDPKLNLKNLSDLAKACIDNMKSGKTGICPHSGTEINQATGKPYICEEKLFYKLVKEGEIPKMKKFSYKDLTGQALGVIYPKDIQIHLAKIPRKTYRSMGIDIIYSHPKDLIMSAILVKPLPSRPATKMGTQERPNEESELYANIIKYNNMLIAKVEEVINEAKLRYPNDENRLAREINIGINNLYTIDVPKTQEGTWRRTTSTATVNPFRQIYETFSTLVFGDKTKKTNVKGVSGYFSGKSGMFRTNSLGTQTDFCGRTVVGPKRGGRTDEVEVPSVLRSALAREVVVTSLNIGYATSLLLQGEIISVDRAGVKYRSNKNDIRDIYIGDIIEIKGQEGDRILLGRQPTLSRHSLKGLRMRFSDTGEEEGRNKTFTVKLPILATTGYNADFDGDEMHVSSLRRERARAENEFVNSMTVCNTTPDGTPIHGFITSFITWAYRLTRGNLIVRQSVVDNIINNLRHTDDLYDYYARVDALGMNPLSGKAVFSLVLPRDFNYIKGSILDDNRVQIINGILYSGTLTKEHLGSSIDGLLVNILRSYGDYRYHDFLEDSVNLLMLWGEEYPDTITLDDCTLDPKGLKIAFTEEDFYDIKMFDLYRKFLIYSKMRNNTGVNGLKEVLDDLKDYTIDDLEWYYFTDSTNQEGMTKMSSMRDKNAYLETYKIVVNLLEGFVNDFEKVIKDESVDTSNVANTGFITTRSEIEKKIIEFSKNAPVLDIEGIQDKFLSLVKATPSLYLILQELDQPFSAIEGAKTINDVDLVINDIKAWRAGKHIFNTVRFPIYLKENFIKDINDKNANLTKYVDFFPDLGGERPNEVARNMNVNDEINKYIERSLLGALNQITSNFPEKFSKLFNTLDISKLKEAKEEYIKDRKSRVVSVFSIQQKKLLGKDKYIYDGDNLYVTPTKENLKFLSEALNKKLNPNTYIPNKKDKEIQDKYLREVKVKIPDEAFNPEEYFDDDSLSNFEFLYSEFLMETKGISHKRLPKVISSDDAKSLQKFQEQYYLSVMYPFDAMSILKEEKRILYDLITDEDIISKQIEKYNRFYRRLTDLYSLLNLKKYDVEESLVSVLDEINAYLDDYIEYSGMINNYYYIEIKGYIIDLIMNNSKDKSKLAETIDKIKDEIQSEIDRIFVPTEDKKIEDYQMKLYRYAMNDIGNKVRNSVIDSIKEQKGALMDKTDVGGGGKGSSTHGVKIAIGLQVFLNGSILKKTLTEGRRAFANDDPDRLTPQMMSNLLTGYAGGLSPNDKVLDSISSRVQLADTNLTTPIVGDLQRKLTKALENLLINERRSVVNVGGFVYQVLFGGHGFNPEEMYRDKGMAVPFNIKQIILNLNAKAGWTKLNTQDVGVKIKTKDGALLRERKKYVQIASVRERELNFLNKQLESLRDFYSRANELTKGLIEVERIRHIGALQGEISKIESQIFAMTKRVTPKDLVPHVPEGRETLNVASRFELAMLIAQRAEMINKGYKPVIKTDVIDSYEIAKMEVLGRENIPLLLKRKTRAGGHEYFKVSELIFPEDVKNLEIQDF